MQYFEVTKQQTSLAKIGREMMDFSESASMTGLKDKDIKHYNDLSEVGYMLTQVGTSFGVKDKDFNSEHRRVIAEFQEFKGSNLPQGGPCLRTTF